MRSLSPWLYWTPRILAILFALFLGIFSFDVFGTGLGFWGTALAFFMHNIPVLILGVITWIAWKREIVGAIVFALAGVLYVAQMVYNALIYGFEPYMLSYALILAGPLFLIGWFFWINWTRKKKN